MFYFKKRQARLQIPNNGDPVQRGAGLSRPADPPGPGQNTEEH